MLLKEVRFFQGKSVNSKKPRKVEDISKVFSQLVLQGKLTAAMKLLDNESSEAADIVEESLLHGPIDYTQSNVYDLIDKESIYNSASKTKGSVGPSEMDAELYKRILCSKNFKTEGKILREELAVSTRNLLRESYHPSFLEAFTSGRLIPLDKNPGIRPIGVGEVLRRIVGKRLAVS